MAERETAAIYCAARGHDVVVYAYAHNCLDDARQLASVLGHEGVIMIYDDDNYEWRWDAPRLRDADWHLEPDEMKL